VFGPFYVPGAPLREMGDSIASENPTHDVLTMSGVVRASNGEPLPDAVLDVWQVTPMDSMQCRIRRSIRRATAGSFEPAAMAPMRSGQRRPLTIRSQRTVRRENAEGDQPSIVASSTHSLHGVASGL